MTEIDLELPNNWTPRWYQGDAWRAMHNRVARRFVLAWHRRAGKDEVSLHRTAEAAMLERVGNYWHLLPQANQARRAIWDAVNPHTGKRRIDEAFPLCIRETTRDNEMMIRFINGSTWQVFGSDNYESGLGSPPVGIVYSEFALSDPNCWTYLAPILEENGGWAAFISTPRGRNHFAHLVEYAMADTSGKWYGEIQGVRQTLAIKPEQLQEIYRGHAAILGDKEAKAIVDQEYHCDFDAAIPGAYYGEHMTTAMAEGRIGDFPWLPHLPVGIATDLGRGDQCVNWFYQQPPGGRIRIIDVLAGSGAGIDWYAKRIAAKPYTIVDTIWPHDGGHSNIRDVNGTNLVTTANGLGWRPIRVIDRDPDINTGITATRLMFPLLEFNTQPIPMPAMGSDAAESPEEARQRMARALNALRQYHREYDEARQCFKNEPFHDWTSDYADGLRYLARGRKPFPGTVNTAGLPSHAIMD